MEIPLPYIHTARLLPPALLTDNFKTLGYALILLRPEGYPCIFYADYYGAEYEEKEQKYTVRDSFSLWPPRPLYLSHQARRIFD